MGKRNIALFFLLLLQVVIIGYIYRPGQDTIQPTIHFFEGIAPEQVMGFTIVEKGSQSIKFNKEQQNWVISSKDNIPAEQEKVTTLITKLTNLQSSRLVTKTKSSHDRLKVGKNFNKKITIHMKDGDDRILYLGTAPSYKTLHVRADNDNRVYLVKDFSSWETPVEASSWWKNQYVDIDSENLTELSLTNSHGSFTIQKDSDGKWQLIGAKNEDKVNETALLDFLDVASRISVSNYLGKEEKDEYGLKKPSTEIKLKSSQESIRIIIGTEDKESGSYVTKSSSSPFYVQVSKYSVTPLIDRKAKDLLGTKSDTNEVKETTH